MQLGGLESPNRKQIWCILAWKSDICWHQFFIFPDFYKKIFPLAFPWPLNSLTFSSFPWPVGSLVVVVVVVVVVAVVVVAVVVVVVVVTCGSKPMSNILSASSRTMYVQRRRFVTRPAQFHAHKQHHQALLKAKYCPRVAAASRAQKNTQTNHVTFDLWPWSSTGF